MYLQLDINGTGQISNGNIRGGRRIGNYDIRIGLPRDRSLVDVAKDPRLQRNQVVQVKYKDFNHK